MTIFTLLKKIQIFEGLSSTSSITSVAPNSEVCLGYKKKKDLISTRVAVNATFSLWRRNKLRKSWKKSCDKLPLGSSVLF
jgi:hypothetical protein